MAKKLSLLKPDLRTVYLKDGKGTGRNGRCEMPGVLDCRYYEVQ